MKKKLLATMILLSFIIVLIPLLNASDSDYIGEEIQITSGHEVQIFPDIHGDRIVYSDTRNGNYDIYVQDLKTGIETQITSDPANQSSPGIWEDRIVYSDYADGDWEIYLYNITSGARTKITELIQLIRSEDDVIDDITRRDARIALDKIQQIDFHHPEEVLIESTNWKGNLDEIKKNPHCPTCEHIGKNLLERAQALAKRRGGECVSKKASSVEEPLLWRCKEGHEWKA